jgi:hypothetical protein
MSHALAKSASTSLARAIARRTRGQTHGLVTRLMSPSGLGEILKPFVFLDLFDNEGKPIKGGLHPHSGIATLTYIAEGVFSYTDPYNVKGLMTAGGVEWMQAGRGMWLRVGVQRDRAPVADQLSRRPAEGGRALALRAARRPHRPLDRHLIGCGIGSRGVAARRPGRLRVVERTSRVRGPDRRRVRSRLGCPSQARPRPRLLFGSHDARRATYWRGAHCGDRAASCARRPPLSTRPADVLPSPWSTTRALSFAPSVGRRRPA